MIAFANIKINLGLWIHEKLPDGYHRIETLMVPAPLSDIIEILDGHTRTTRVTLSGLPVEGDYRDNLCYRAWELLHQEFAIPPVLIHLHKMIPTGAGLGGGSSDGAFTLKMLNSIFDLNVSPPKLRELALRLGMDCPFFIGNIPAMAGGKGEVLTNSPVQLSHTWLVIIKPPLHISTAAAYAGIQPRPRHASLTELLSTPEKQWRDLLENDFEKTIFRQFPEIEDVKRRLYETGAYYAQMSGSGAAVFGLFHERPGGFNLPKGYFSYMGYFGAASRSQTATML